MKSRYLWALLFFATALWVWVLPLYFRADPLLGSVCLALAVATGAIACREEGASGLGSRAAAAFRGARFLLLVLTLQAVVAWGYVWVASDARRLDFLAWPAAWVLRLAGFDGAVGEGRLHLWNSQLMIPFSANCEKLSVLPGLLFFAAAGVGILGSGGDRRLRRLAAAAAVVVAFVVLRFALLASVFMELEDPFQASPPNVALFVDPWLTTAGLALLAVVLGRLVPLDLARLASGAAAGSRRRLAAALGLAGLAVFLGTGAYLFQDPGRVKAGGILVDDLHSKRWERSNVSMGKEDFGSEPVYSYSSLAYWLRHYFDVDVNLERPLDELPLADYATVVLKTPAARYSPAEVEAVTRYVREGGGLFLIGDHTNLLGMSTFLNQIASRFGFRFNFDSSNQFSTNFFTEYRSQFPWEHPTVKNIRSFSFLTSCTLDVPLWSEKAMIGLDAFSDRMDYSKPSFFGDIIVMPDDDFGPVVLGAAKKVGRGRVSLFTDSTVFSNFCLFQDDHDTYFLNTLAFLGRENRWGYGANAALLAGASSSLLGALWLGARRAREFTLWAPLAVWAAFAAGSLFWGGVNGASYPRLQPRVPPVRVAFLGSHSEFYLPPALGRAVVPPEVAFDTFFMAVQRLGLFPFHAREVGEAVAGAGAVVLINPVESFFPAELEALQAYVQRGGRLLVLDTIANRRPHLREILDGFGIEARRTTSSIEFPGGDAREVSFDDLKEKPPTALRWCAKGYGQGRVVALADSQFFSRLVLGNVMDQPGPLSKRVLDLIYEIFEGEFGLRPNLEYR